jgi:MFS family permease
VSSTDGLRAVRYGKWPLIALASTVALETGERMSLSQAIDGIQDDFGVSDLALGWLTFAMVLIGVLGAFPIGALTDRVRHRNRLLAGAMVIWTVVMGLNGLATSFTLLFIARMGVGAVEANGPAAISLLSDYYPVDERAKRMGLYQSGAFLGAMVGLLGGGVAVGLGGWRWAFFMWVPFGVISVVLLLRQPEPARGDQDSDFEVSLAVAGETLAASGLPAALAVLPAARREGTLDYSTCTNREVLREICRIPSMWFGVLSLTVGQLMLASLQFWGVQYFKRVHELSDTGAGAVTALLGIGSIAGILGGGFLADRYLRRGYVNARVYVTAAGSVAASVVLVPAFASTSLAVTAPLFFLGGVFLTLPVAPSEAMVSDVVVSELRGRAATIRSVVRALSATGPLLVGWLSSTLGDDADSLRWALVAITPVYAVGGLLMLRAARHYPADLAYVVAESRRARESRGDRGVET